LMFQKEAGAKDGMEEGDEEEMEEVDSDEWEEYEDEPIPVTGQFTRFFLLSVS
jgi:hypothetical protein